MTQKTSAQEMSFEMALARLEELVTALEQGNTDLDASLSAFEEGIGLVRFCTDKLNKAEQKVKVLIEKENGYEEEDLT